MSDGISPAQTLKETNLERCIRQMLIFSPKYKGEYPTKDEIQQFVKLLNKQQEN